MTPPTHRSRATRRGAALLPAAGAMLLWLAGCATAPGNTPEAAAPPPEAAASAPASAASAAVAAASAPEAAASAATADATPAVDAPIDPLRPEVRVDLDDRSAHLDLWDRVRRGFAMPDIDNDLVHNWEQWYVARPDYVQRMTDRGGRFLFHVIEEVDKRGLPTELALLPFIESAFNPQAMSVAQASGMWQFVPSTGRDFALKQNVFRDDRRDVLASTRAALDYLSRLYAEFNDWHLALAAYNWGEGNVRRAVAYNQRHGRPTDYLSLRMPAETRNYVPKLQAVKNLVLHPDQFAVQLPELSNHPYFLSVPIERDIDVQLAANLAGLPLDEFKLLNPQMNKPVILAAGTPQVLLPYDNANTFVRNIQSHTGPLATWTAWVAPKTLRPADAAKRVGVSEATLREVNHIPPRMLVKAGSTLLVPRSEHRDDDVPEALADNATMALAPDRPAERRLRVKAGKHGDTVAAVAKRYHVSAAQVADWNHTSEGARFKPGAWVTLFVPNTRSKATTRTASSHRSKAVSRHKVASRKTAKPTVHVAKD